MSGREKIFSTGRINQGATQSSDVIPSLFFPLYLSLSSTTSAFSGEIFRGERNKDKEERIKMLGWQASLGAAPDKLPHG
jgi:hypothetical protein